MTTICEMLVESGFTVRALATTATERSSKSDAATELRKLGLKLQIDKGRTGNRIRPEILFEHRGVSFRLMDTGRHTMADWQPTLGRQFDLAFDEELKHFQPDVILTFGGHISDIRRHKRARNQGIKVVFGLRNESYMSAEFFEGVDGVLTPSQYMTDLYREKIGITSVPLPTPIEPSDVVAEEHDPIFVTMVNPNHVKGVMLFARIAEEVSLRRPDIPFLAIEARGTAGTLANAALSSGFDLRRHENVMISSSVPTPKDIFTAAKLLLAPSLMEPSGRVVAEALMNGVPPLVSDRGGLAESANGAGFVIPIPQDLNIQTVRAVTAEEVAPWVERIIQLEDDAEQYAREAQKAKEASRVYLRENLAPRYVKVFLDVLAGTAQRPTQQI
jgi:glycosyltransferase involved in cell wall biosynthesis